MAVSGIPAVANFEPVFDYCDGIDLIGDSGSRCGACSRGAVSVGSGFSPTIAILLRNKCIFS